MSATSGLRWLDEEDQPLEELLKACYVNDTSKVLTLIQSGVNVNDSNDDKDTPLQVAASQGHIGLVILLLDNGAIIDQPNKVGYTPFLHACREGRDKIVELLIQRGASPYNTTYFGATALTLACAGGHIEVIKFLISIRSEVNPKIKLISISPTPLMAAVISGKRMACSLLVTRGADIDASHPNLEGLNSLILSVICNNPNIVYTLLDMGANPRKTIGTKKKLDALQCAEYLKNDNIINIIKTFYGNRFLKDTVVKEVDLRDVIKENDIKMLSQLINEMKTTKRIPFFEYGTTLLMYTVFLGTIDSLRLVFETFGQKDNQEGRYGMTALMFAIIIGENDFIKYLLQKECDTRIQSNDSFTALDLAYYSTSIDKEILIMLQKSYYGKYFNDKKGTFPNFEKARSSNTFNKSLIIPIKSGFLSKFNLKVGFSDSYESDYSKKNNSKTNGREKFLQEYETMKFPKNNLTRFITADEILRNEKICDILHEPTYDDYIKLAYRMSLVCFIIKFKKNTCKLKTKLYTKILLPNYMRYIKHYVIIL
uniref:ANK_REP_REGION domain-containing protein n=1 Tax=Strongyloides venezuelensis TaxID=75913 RepID=A0A0K0FUI2_STRVS